MQLEYGGDGLDPVAMEAREGLPWCLLCSSCVRWRERSPTLSRTLNPEITLSNTGVPNQVRNSAGGIVQLEYGDDGLDPVAMEAGEGRPLDLPRSLALVRATTPRAAGGNAPVAAAAVPAPPLPENAGEEGARRGSCTCCD